MISGRQARSAKFGRAGVVAERIQSQWSGNFGTRATPKSAKRRAQASVERDFVVCPEFCLKRGQPGLRLICFAFGAG